MRTEPGGRVARLVPEPAHRRLGRVAVITRRSPLAMANGGQRATATVLEALRRVADEVDVFEVSRRGVLVHEFRPQRAPRSRSVAAPRTVAGTCSVALQLLRRRRALNEVFVGDRRLARNGAIAYDTALVDTIRVHRFAQQVLAPTRLLFLDDLLSDRYAAAAGLSMPELALHHRLGASAVGARVVRPLARRILRWEAAILRQREVDLGREYGAVLLTSPTEATEFRRRSGREDVYATSVAVERPPTREKDGPVPTGVAYVGDFRYFDNIEGLAQLVGALSHDPGPPVKIIGRTPRWVRRRFTHPSVQFEGFVERLDDHLGPSVVSVVLGGNPGGVKTKVLDALACGSPVVALRGLLTDRQWPFGAPFLHEAPTPADVVRLARDLSGDRASCRAAGKSGRAWAERNLDASATIAQAAEAITRGGS